MSIENIGGKPPRTTLPRFVLPTVIGVVAFVIGIAAGAGNAGAAPEATPAPTVTVTATSEPVETVKEVTKEVEVTVVPQACKDALTDADALQQISGEMANEVAGHLGDDARLFEQFSTFDFENVDWYMDGQDSFNASIEDLTTRVTVNTYVTNRDACLAS